MGNIKYASKIDFSNQGLTEIPEEIFSYRNLRVLILRNNQLTKIPIELTRLKSLKKLDVSGNRITQVLAKTFELKKLEVLNLSNNQLKNLPKQIVQQSQLKKILLNGNLLTSLPVELSHLPHLTHLGIANNKFTGVPDTLWQLEHLTHLWLANNPLTNLPAAMFTNKLPNLQAIYNFNPAYRGTDELSHSLFQTAGNTLSEIKLAGYVPATKSPWTAQSMQRSVFISYSHRDVDFKNEVEVTLKSLQHAVPSLQFDYWSDDQLLSGVSFEEQIEHALSKSGVAILLVSRHFLASKFIANKELPTILRRAQTNGVRMLVLVIGASLLDELPITKYQFVHDPARPLHSLGEHERDIVYQNLGKDVLAHYRGEGKNL